MLLLPVTRLGPVRAAASVRIVSRARMSLEATRPRPLPWTEAALTGRHLVRGRCSLRHASLHR